MSMMNKGKFRITERLELPNQEIIIIVNGKVIYKNLGILEVNMLKQNEMKKKLAMNTSEQLKC